MREIKKIKKSKKNIVSCNNTIKNNFLALTSLFLLSSLFYLVGIIYINTNYQITISTSTPQNIQEEMKFVFVDEDTTQYEVFQKDIHGAWIDRSFLFWKDDKDDKDNQENTEWKNKKNGTVMKKDYVGGENVNDMINKFENESKNGKENEKEKKNEKKNNNTDKLEISPYYPWCMLPWGEKLDDGEWKLAYQQRSDEPNFCNIQKRTCNSWKLSGSYTQKSCKKNIPVKITTKEVILFNTKKNDPLIQSAHRPNKVFKEYEIKDKNNTVWNNNIKWWITKSTPVQQEKTTEKNCIAPWGEKVNNGQFIKAYYDKYGFTDKVCEVELRICLDGKLQWNFSNPNCTHIDNYTSEERYSDPNNN